MKQGQYRDDADHADWPDAARWPRTKFPSAHKFLFRSDEAPLIEVYFALLRVRRVYCHVLCCFASSAEFCRAATAPHKSRDKSTKTKNTPRYRHILATNPTHCKPNSEPTMPPRVESYASLSRSIDSTESVKGGKSFLIGPRDASSPTASSSTAAPPSAELRTTIENQADRRGYVVAPTPIEHMPRLSNLSENGPQLYVKRDDVS